MDVAVDQRTSRKPAVAESNAAQPRRTGFRSATTAESWLLPT